MWKVNKCHTTLELTIELNNKRELLDNTFIRSEIQKLRGWTESIRWHLSTIKSFEKYEEVHQVMESWNCTIKSNDDSCQIFNKDCQPYNIVVLYGIIYNHARKLLPFLLWDQFNSVDLSFQRHFHLDFLGQSISTRHHPIPATSFLAKIISDKYGMLFLRLCTIKL